MPTTSNGTWGRDALVDGALLACSTAECQARYGYVCEMRVKLTSAKKSLCEALRLCSGVPTLGEPVACGTAEIFPCPETN
jgi:hypothetical protein